MDIINFFKRKPCGYWSTCGHRDEESPTCKSDLEAAEAFVNKYPGYKKDYGANFIKEAIVQIFF